MKFVCIVVLLLFGQLCLRSQDIITLKSGKVVECSIIDQDSAKYYISLQTKGSTISTFIDKAKVSSVTYAKSNMPFTDDVTSVIERISQSGLYKYGGKYWEAKDLRPLLMTEPAAFPHIKKHRTNLVFSYIFSFSGGYLVGYELGKLFVGQEIRWPSVGLGAGLAIVGVLLEGASKNNFKDAISAFNQSKLNNSRLDQSHIMMYPSNLGVAFKF